MDMALDLATEDLGIRRGLSTGVLRDIVPR